MWKSTNYYNSSSNLIIRSLEWSIINTIEEVGSDPTVVTLSFISKGVWKVGRCVLCENIRPWTDRELMSVLARLREKRLELARSKIFFRSLLIPLLLLHLLEGPVSEKFSLLYLRVKRRFTGPSCPPACWYSATLRPSLSVTLQTITTPSTSSLTLFYCA